ncbi:MAG TPA: hypothetical protein VN493_28555 [Thermoanaerobaculia bacterium]|nr:hypothetical protein [Thermoanaerobaculia bacterium]
MASNLSIAQMLKQLEERVAHHRERQTFHAEQEMLHRERTAHHAAGLETAIAHLEAFRAASTAAGDLLERDKPAAPLHPTWRPIPSSTRGDRSAGWSPGSWRAGLRTRPSEPVP